MLQENKPGACMYVVYMYMQGASPAAGKAAGRRLAYAQNVCDGVVMEVRHDAKSLIYTLYVFLFSQSSKIRYCRRRGKVVQLKEKKHSQVYKYGYTSVY